MAEYLDNGSLVVLTRLADGTPAQTRHSTPGEQVQWQFDKNTPKYGLPLFADATWTATIGAVVIPNAGSIDVANRTSLASVGFDVDASLLSGLRATLFENTYDDQGKLTRVGFEPNAHMEISLSRIGQSFDVLGAPMAVAPWTFISVESSGAGDFGKQNLLINFRDGTAYVNNKWVVFDDLEAFNYQKDFDRRRFITTGDVKLIGGSRLLTGVEITRIPADDVYTIKLRLFAPGEGEKIEVDFVPCWFPGDQEPDVISNSVSTQFESDPTLACGTFVSNVLVSFGDTQDVPDMSEIILLKSEVQTAKRDVGNVQVIAERNSARLSRIEHLAGVPGALVQPGNVVHYDGAMWAYNGTAAINLPATIAEITEAWFQANNFTEYMGTGTGTGGSNGLTPFKERIPPSPYWPVVANPANTNGSLLVRKGETTTVTATMVLNNGFAGSNQLVQTFSAAERGKTYVTRIAIPDANKQGRIDLAARTTAQGVIGDYSLTYANGAWTAQGGSVKVDNGMAVFEVAVPFSATMDTLLYRWVTPGQIQDLTLYELGKSGIAENTIGITATAPDGTARNILDADRARLNAVEAKLNNTAPIFEVGGTTRADALPFITIPDRVGARFDSLSFIAGDGRKVSGGFEYVGRQKKFTVPASWLDMGAVAGRTGWTPETFDGRNSLKTRLDYTAQAGSTTIYDIWLQWRRNTTSWDIWFQGQHTTTNTKPINQFCGAYDITANYVLDATAVDPGLAPLQASVTANATAIAANSTAIAAETTRAKKAEGDNALNISTLTASVQVNASSITAIQNDFARKINLLKRSPRTKVWTATLAGLTITGGALNDATATNQIPLEPDLDAPVFAAIVNPGPATVRFGVTGLVIGEKYEFIMKEGIALAKAVGLPTNFVQTNTPDWRVYKLVFTADKTTMDGFFTLTGSANLQGPAVYRTPGVFGHDKDLNEIRLAEPSDVVAPSVDLSAYAKLTDIPVATKPVNPNWFSAERDFGKTYTRNTKSGTQATSISFDFISNASPFTVMSVNLPAAGAPISGWTVSGFWGAPTAFISVTPPGGVAMTLAVVAWANGKVEIGVGPTTGNGVGRVRNVIIDGIAADTI